MPLRTFVAFSSADPLVSDTITMACEAARLTNREFTPWNRNDTSGLPIDQSVSGWVEGADALMADISEPNHNVTFEVGLALGAEKQIRLIRAANKDRTLLEEIGLLHYRPRRLPKPSRLGRHSPAAVHHASLACPEAVVDPAHLCAPRLQGR
jgi:hypothetical protein